MKHQRHLCDGASAVEHPELLERLGGLVPRYEPVMGSELYAV
jgi:hypothetical protein